jgi:hypothetical protein
MATNNSAHQFHWGPTNPHQLSKMRTELVCDTSATLEANP